MITFAVPLAVMVAAGQPPDTSAVLDAHKATVASIRSLHCKVTRVIEVPNVLTVRRSGEVWIRGDRVRAVGTQDEGRTRQVVVVANGVSRGVVTRRDLGGDAEDASGSITDGEGPLALNVLADAAITFPGVVKFFEPLADILEHARPDGPAIVRTCGGVDCAVITISHKRGRVSLWFDPATNYLVRKAELTSPGVGNGPALQATREVVRFREVGPGVFFPAEVRTLATRHDGVHTETVTFEDVTVNGTIDESAFALKFPPNILVVDKLHRTVNRTDADGNPTLVAKNHHGSDLVYSDGPFDKPGVPADATDVSDEPTLRPTVTREDRSWPWWWLAAVAAAVLAGAVAVRHLVARWGVAR